MTPSSKYLYAIGVALVSALVACSAAPEPSTSPAPVQSNSLGGRTFHAGSNSADELGVASWILTETLTGGVVGVDGYDAAGTAIVSLRYGIAVDASGEKVVRIMLRLPSIASIDMTSRDDEVFFKSSGPDEVVTKLLRVVALSNEDLSIARSGDKDFGIGKPAPRTLRPLEETTLVEQQEVRLYCKTNDRHSDGEGKTCEPVETSDTVISCGGTVLAAAGLAACPASFGLGCAVALVGVVAGATSCGYSLTDGLGCECTETCQDRCERQNEGTLRSCNSALCINHGTEQDVEDYRLNYGACLTGCSGPK